MERGEKPCLFFYNNLNRYNGRYDLVCRLTTCQYIRLKRKCRFFNRNVLNANIPFCPSSIERLRAERLQREAEEKRKAKALLDQKNGGKEKEREKEVEERDRPYNSGFFPELARKRQRRDRDSWRDGLI